jgi:hypothetical protein
MRRRIWGVWAFLVLLLIVAACGVDAGLPELGAEQPVAAREWEGAEAAEKAALRAAYVASVQRDAGPDYRIAQTASGLRVENKAQGLVAAFAGTGVQLGHAAGEEGEGFGIAATQWGCKGAMLPVGAAEPEQGTGTSWT